MPNAEVNCGMPRSVQHSEHHSCPPQHCQSHLEDLQRASCCNRPHHEVPRASHKSHSSLPPEQVGFGGGRTTSSVIFLVREGMAARPGWERGSCEHCLCCQCRGREGGREERSVSMGEHEPKAKGRDICPRKAGTLSPSRLCRLTGPNSQ